MGELLGEQSPHVSSAPCQFSMVEIEINSRCNRACSYCPNSIAPRRGVETVMSVERFSRILDRLAEVHFAGRLSYHFYNEPLLHPRIFDLIRLAAKVLPSSRQVLFTNGDFMTAQVYDDLLASGIALIVATQHDGLIRPAWPNLIWLTPRDLQLTNRGGSVPFGPPPELETPCTVPATMLIITISGNVVLCYEDATEREVLGNVFESSLHDVWLSPRFVRLREALAVGNRRCSPLCKACNNSAHQTMDAYDYRP